MGHNKHVRLHGSKFSGILLAYATLAPTYWVDVSDTWTERLQLLAIHQSQFEKKLKAIEGMITNWAASQGERAGVTFAEQFRVQCYRNGEEVPHGG